MEEHPPRNPLSTKRIVFLFVTAYVAGGLAGTFLCLRQPKIYEATSTLDSPDHVGHPERITRLRAQMVARDIDLEARLDTTFDRAVTLVEDSVRLETSPTGVIVKVRHTDSRDALMIAKQVALGLDTPQQEAAMAAKGIQVAPLKAHEIPTAADIEQLAWLLYEDAAEAGYQSCFDIAKLAAEGDATAIAVMNGEDFSRRFQMMKDLSPKIGYFNPPGEPFKGPNLFAKFGQTPLDPVSPVPELWINGGRGIASLCAGVLFLALNRWKPSVLRPYPAKPPRTPKPRTPSPPPVNADPW